VEALAGTSYCSEFLSLDADLYPDEQMTLRRPLPPPHRYFSPGGRPYSTPRLVLRTAPDNEERLHDVPLSLSL